MAGLVVAVLVAILVPAYVIGIFVYDHFRKKKGYPSLFVEICDSEGHGKRLVRQFHRAKKRG